MKATEGKNIDAACIGYDEAELPCERELQDLGEYSACTVVAHDLDVDDDGELVGTMLISFGADYSKDRLVDPEIAGAMAEVVNDVIARKAAECICDCAEVAGDDDKASDAGCNSCCAPCADKIEAEREALVHELGELLELLKKFPG